MWSASLAGGLLAVWALRAVLADPLHTLWGQSIDAVHAMWVVWWLPQDHSLPWVDHPYGSSGAILPPLGMAMAAQLGAFTTPAFAYSALCLGSIVLDLVMLGILTARVSRSPRAAAVAPLLFLTARPVLAQVAMGNPESVSVGWLCAGVWAGLAWSDRPFSHLSPAQTWVREGAWSLGVGTLFAISVIENPYTLVPGLVAALVLAARRLRRPRGVQATALAAVAGFVLIGWRLWAVGGRPGGTILPYDRLRWMGLEWQLYDTQTLYVQQLIWPGAMPELGAVQEAVATMGAHHFLGFTLMALAAVSAGRRTRVWLVAAAVAILLALGSAPLGNPGPPGLFVGLNQLLSAVIAPITQPERFLVFAVLALSICAGLGMVRLARRLRPDLQTVAWLGLVGLVTAEALAWGGPAIAVPTLSTRPYACLGELPDGAVYTYQDTRVPGLQSAGGMFLQTIHHQPGTHHGLSGWSETDDTLKLGKLVDKLHGSLLHHQDARARNLHLRDLRCYGVQWALVPSSKVWPAAEPVARACGDWVVVPLQDLSLSPCHATLSADGTYRTVVGEVVE